jgi:hypothetical protein
MSATDHLKHKQKRPENVLLFMFSMRGTHENLYSLNTHSWRRYKLRWPYQMSHAIFTCAVVTPIRYTVYWHLFLCCVIKIRKKNQFILNVSLLVSVSGWTIFIRELYLVPDCGIDGSLSAPTFPGFELITLTRLSSFHFAVVRLSCFHF